MDEKLLWRLIVEMGVIPEYMKTFNSLTSMTGVCHFYLIDHPFPPIPFFFFFFFFFFFLKKNHNNTPPPLFLKIKNIQTI